MRPQAPTRPLIPVGEKRKVRDVLDQISAKQLDALENNAALQPCCRNAKQHDVELFKTHDDAPGPDLMVLTCSCGRRHFRMAGGGGKTT